MNLDVVRTIFENGSDYYIVQKDNNVIFCFIECEIEKKKFEDLTVADLNKINSYVIDKNIYLNSTYSPFQEGLTVAYLDRCESVGKAKTQAIEEFGKKLEDVTVPFIGGIGMNEKELLIKLMTCEKGQAWEYIEIIKEFVKEFLFNKKI
jgi:hypothetical protein